MLNALEQILCYIENLPTLIVDGAVTVLNLVIVAIGAAIAAIAAVLPSMPSSAVGFLPDSVLSAANWFYPIGAVVTALGVVVTIWVAYLLLKIALNWLKVIGV